jgi:hypothetical protein
MATKTAKAPKNKTTAQRAAAVRKTILADIRALDKARRMLERNLDSLYAVIDLGEDKLGVETYSQLVNVSNALGPATETVRVSLAEKAEELADTYTAR